MQEMPEVGTINSSVLKINLRKANALQESIMEIIRSINLDYNITLTEFDDVDAKLAEEHASFSQKVERINMLYSAYYDIRKAVSYANNTYPIEDGAQSISDLLATIALTEKQIGVLHNIANASARTDINVIKGKLSKIANSVEQSSLYGRREDITTSILNQEAIDYAKVRIASLKKVKRDLQDKLLERNVSTKVMVAQRAIDILNHENLI